MPWCDGCARFLNPNTLRSDGTCPSCDQRVADPSAPSAESKANISSPPQEPVTAADLGLDHLPESETEMPKAPWHFKLLVVLTVVYLAWRFVQVAAPIAG